MGKGKIQYWVETLLWGFVGVILLVTAYGFIRGYPGYDDTDDAVNGERSNMVLHTDYGTGCQYLSTRSLFTTSTPVPRLDDNGNHVCY